MAQSFPFYNTSDFSLPLNEVEIRALKKSFPNLESSNIKKLGPATRDLMILQDREGKTVQPREIKSEEHIKQLCNLHGCDVKEDYYVKSADGKSIKHVDAETCLIMKSYNIDCITLTRTSLEYNCLGWTLGIRGWINPHEGDISKSEVSTTLEKFLKAQQFQFPKNHEKNALHILDKIQVGDQCINGNNNIGNVDSSLHQLAFFFKPGKNDVTKLEMTHGARYLDILKEVNNTEIQSWTSKLGHELLISHKLNDLSDNGVKATYGLPLCYAFYEVKNSLVSSDGKSGIHEHDEL